MSLVFGIRQQSADSISIYPTTAYFTNSGGSDYSTVTSSSNWSYIVATRPSWVTVTNGSGSSGQNFSYDVATNPAPGNPRSCDIRICLVSDNNIYMDLHIDQYD